MKVNDILNKLNDLTTPAIDYKLFTIDNYRYYFGKDRLNNIIFVIESTNDKLKAFSQETKNLEFFFNLEAKFTFNDAHNIIETKTVHLLKCKNMNADVQEAFVRLTQAFALNNFDEDQYYLTKLFTILTALFSKEEQVSKIELQGLYAELYSILYLNEKGCDISSFWQSRDKMKFDFSINGKKRIEVKSTTKANRIHRFSHDQLLSDLYEIKVVSVMLQENDCGLSLRDLINKVFATFDTNMSMLFHIEQLIRNVCEGELSALKYDEAYTKNNLKIFNAANIPHFEEFNPDGVSNTEYDCDLSGCSAIEISEFNNWIKDGKN